MPFETLDQLITWQPPAIHQYIGSHILMPGTKMLIFGGPKTFKSIIAQVTGFCLLTGMPWMGFPVNPVQKVAYFQFEIPKVPFRSRVLKTARYLGPNMVNAGSRYYMETDMTFKMDTKKSVEYLHNVCKTIQPQVLILDPWYKMLSVEENRVYGTTQDIMDELIQTYGVSIILIHHDTVPQFDPQGNEIRTFHPRGPRTLEGWFDTMVKVEGDIASDDRTLYFETRHSETLIQPVRVRLDRNTLWFTVQ